MEESAIGDKGANFLETGMQDRISVSRVGPTHNNAYSRPSTQ